MLKIGPLLKMYHMLMLLLVTAYPTVIGYTLLLRQQDREGGFCVTDDDHRTVVFIPDISIRPTIPSAINNAQQPWTSEWQLYTLFKRSNYWSADRMWHDLGQISTYSGDGPSQPVNFDRSKNILPQQIFLSVLAKSVEIYLKFKCVLDYYPYQVEIDYCMSVDVYDEATKKKGVRLKKCKAQDVCTIKNFTVVDLLENGRNWVHLELHILNSTMQGIEIKVKKRGKDFHHLLHDNTNKYSSVQLISASFKSNEGAAFFKLHEGEIVSPSLQSDIAVIKRTFKPYEGRNMCLDITWKHNLPNKLHFEIKTQYRTILSRSYVSPSFEFEMKTRLSEYLPHSGTYTITLEYQSNGGVGDISFCSNKKDAIQIIHSDDHVKGCQLLVKADQNYSTVIETNCTKTYASTPAAFPSVLPAICSKIEGQLYGFCDNYKVCDYHQCICIHKVDTTHSQGTAKTEPKISTSTPESADQNSIQELSKNSSYNGTSTEATCPWSKQLLTVLKVFFCCLCVVIGILTVMAVQSYRSLKELDAAEECTPQNNFELQPIPGISTNTGYPH